MSERKKKLGVLKTLLLIIAVILLGAIVVTVLAPSRTSGHEAAALKERYVTTVAKLSQIRYAIQHFHEKNGRYPDSLNDLKKYVKQDPLNPDWLVIILDFKERISSREGNANETNKLDGSGGWYYNKETGEVKVNITKPVESYLGPTVMSTDIPSEW